MLGKIPKPGTGFRGLVSYLMHGDRDPTSFERVSAYLTTTKDKPIAASTRVAWTETRNLLTNNPEVAPALMRFTASKSLRVKRPVYHYVISWRPEERPSRADMCAIADRTCDDLGLTQHQRFYVAHHDTPHPHVHIVVNRVHPETGRAWSNAHDYRRIEQSLARQSRERGYQPVPGRHTERTFLSRKLTGPKRARDPDFQRTRREKAKPSRTRLDLDQITKLRDDLRPVFTQAWTWDMLDRALTARKVSLQRKGQGLVIVLGSAEMKLSDLGAGIRLSSLEKRFGQSFDAYLAARQRQLELQRRAQALQPIIVQPTPVPRPQPTLPAPTRRRRRDRDR